MTASPDLAPPVSIFPPRADDGRKECTVCGRLQAFSAFAHDASKRSGRKSACKLCDADKSARYYAANRDRKPARRLARMDRRRVDIVLPAA